MKLKRKWYILAIFFITLIIIIAVVLFSSRLWMEKEHVVLALPVMPWSYWTAFYTAEIQGYYAEEGLNVSFIYVPEGGFGIIKQVGSGNAMFGYTGGDSLLIARSKGIPVVMVYQDTHSSPWSLIAKKNITDLKYLEGKTIAIQGPNNPLHLAAIAMLKKTGVNPDNITWVPVGGHAIVSTFLGGITDAIVGNELYEIILKKKKADFNIWYAKNYGIDLDSLGILTSEDILKNNPKLVEKFLRATKKGEEYAIAHSEESVNAYISRFNPSADKEIEIEVWKVYKDGAIQPDRYPLGQFNKSQWLITHDTLYELGVMERKVEVGSAYTEEFLSKI